MKLDEAVELNEAKGSGSFDYRYWFWAKKSTSTYGLGYARQDVQVDIRSKGSEAVDAIDNINDVLQSISKDDTENLEVVEKKVKANTKRLKGIVDLFHSPIVIHWLNNDPPKVVEIPKTKEGDVKTSDGKHINVVDLFDDKNTSEFIKKVLDWDQVTINDNVTTLNTITAKFIRDLFQNNASEKEIRKIARTAGLDRVMTDLDFEADGIKVKSFSESDYKLLPEEHIGSKKIVSKLKGVITDNFPKLLKAARAHFE